MNVKDILREVENGVEIDIMVSPKSDRLCIEEVDIWRKMLVVRVKAPPLEGRANKEVEKLFSDTLKCKCIVIKGMTSRQKTIFIPMNKEDVLEKLE